MIRTIAERDIPRLKELECGLSWQFGRDYMDGLVMTDADDVPVMFMGAWRVAEVHMLADPSWSTPGARLAALQQLHYAMEQRLWAHGVGQAVTWLDDMKAFTRRMIGLGWVKSSKTSWHRRVG
jgi:hypothetical protein